MRVTNDQLNFCLDRAVIMSTILPKPGHSCVDNPLLLCDACERLSALKPRVELSLAPSGTVLCQLFLGDYEVDSFSPGLYC